MGTLNINGKRVKVDDSFARLSPADQQKTVEEIAAQMGGGEPAAPAPEINMSVTDRFAAMPEQPNAQRSQLPGVLGQFDNTSRAAQAGFNDLLTSGFGDELYAGATAPFRALPGLFNGEGYDIGKAYNAGYEMTRDTQEDTRKLNPTAYVGGQIAGAIVSPVGRGKTAATTGGRIFQGGRQGAIQGGLYGFGSAEGDAQERSQGALAGGVTGGVFGAALPWLAKKGGDAVEGFMQNRATSQAIKNAPDAEDLSAAASQLFKESKSAGVGVKPQVFGTFARDTAAKARSMDIDPELDQAAWTVYERLIERARQGFADPSSLSLSRLHNLRQMAQDVVIEAKKPRTKGFAQQIVDGLDEMIGKLKPADLSLPADRLGGPNSANAANAGNALLDGISTWAKARRVSLVEQAIAKAQNYPSGFESGLVNQFRSLLNNKSTSKLFTEPERRALQAVVRGTAPVKVLRTLGIFKGLGGAVVGSSMGPWGAAAGWAAGNVGKKITETATSAAAQRAAKIVATPNIPKVTVRNPFLALPGYAAAPPVINEIQRRRLSAPTR